jgi:Tfp pilus assembly protein PilF
MTITLTIPTKLEDAIKNNTLVIFVGAGCSIPLGMPSWKKLVEDILQDLDNKYGQTSDTNFKNILNGVQNGSKSLFDALSKIENDSDNGTTFKIKTQEFINSRIEEISKSLPEESNVHNLLWEISNKIITTNYDKILEQYIPKSISPKKFDNSNAFQSLKSQSNNAEFLYKIHGDYEDPKSIILFESDYRDIYKNENYNTDTLATHFKEKTLLFIGFSLTDPFVNDLFIKIKNIYQGYSVSEHFILTTKNEDFIKYDVTPIKINNWKDDLLNYLLELKKIKLEVEKKEQLTIVKEKVQDKELTKDDVNNIVELITKKTNDLVNDPSNKELIKELKDLRTKLDKLLFEKVDYLQEVDKPFRDSNLQILFDSIYSSEKLNSQTLEQIQKIRNNSDKYKWYDRSVIVSAICCSLIHFNKADEQKITLLIDFINDNEEKVWQKAITSLFITLNHLANKWLKFNSIKTKITSLNQNLRVQDACSKIIKVFNVGLNNISMVSEELFENPYFSDSPFNYFFPYHQEKNPAFDLVYETYKGDDIEDFITFLDEVPIPDQVKYLICSETNKKGNNDEDDEENKKYSDNLIHILNYNSFLFPYSIYVQEIISFYNSFPKYKHEEKLKSQLKLTETPLKDYLLNQKQKYSALGSHFMREKAWSQAIVNFKESLKLDENDISDLLNLANCYKNNKEKEKEFSLRIKIKSKEPKNENNLAKLFMLYYNDKKDYNACLQISNELLTIDKKSDQYYNFRGISFNKLGFKKEAIEDYTESINLNSNSDTYYYNRSLIFHEEGNHQKSINDVTKAIKIDKKSSDFLLHRASDYLALLSYDKALMDIQHAESISKNKEEIYNSYSNYYRITGDFDKAFEYIGKAENLKKQYNFIGTKATIYASMGDNINFYRFLEIALQEGGDVQSLYPDIRKKFKNEPEFIALAAKYNQKV